MSKPEIKPPLLCLITDPTIPDLTERVEMALAAGVNMLQLRGHQLSAAQLYTLAVVFRPLCLRYGAIFIMNDRLDVGLAVQADGFQLGGQSLSPLVAREIVGEGYLLGASVHGLAEAQVALTNGADFLVAGTIFASRSHPGDSPSGTGLVHAIKKALPAHPVLAVGGITAGNAARVMEAGADGIALISAILRAANVRDAVHELRMAIGLSLSSEDRNRKGVLMSETVGPDSTSISIVLNGQLRTVRDGSTIADILSDLSVAPIRVVAQLDGVIVARSEFDHAVLKEGCQLEIVTLVGGG